MLCRLIVPPSRRPRRGLRVPRRFTAAAPAALFVLLAPPALRAGDLAGSVVGPDGSPTSGAEVEVLDLHRRTRTDADGRYRFADLPAGSWLVDARSRNLGAALRRIEVPAEGEVTLDLVLENVRHEDEIVVTGAGSSRSQLELAQPTTVLTGEDLVFRRQATLGETLAGEAGVSSTSFGAGASRPVVRGQGGDRVRMLQGGVGTGDVSSTSPDHAVSLDPAAAERVEVVRGPASLLYGSSAIGGVVNVLDARIPDHRPSTPFGGTVELRGASVADERAGSVGLDGGAGNLAWHVDLSRSDADDYEIPGHPEVDPEPGEEAPGILANSDVETRSGGLGFAWFTDAGRLGMSVSGFDSLYGVPGVAHAHGDEHGEEHEEGEDHDEHDDEEDDHGHEEGEQVRIDLQRRRFDLEGDVLRAFGPFRALRTRFGWVDYEHVELEGEEREVGTVFTNELAELRAELVQQERGPWSGSVGIQVSRKDLEAVGEEAFLPPAETTGAALFTFQELVRGTLRWQLGGRLETSEIDAEGRGSRSFASTSASLGLVWAPNDVWSATASVAHSTKAPNAEELYSDGPHFATGSFEVGDPDLDLETSLGVDLSVRARTDRFRAELSLFSNAFDDYIHPRFTGEEEDGLPVLLYVQEDADFRGAELSGRAVLWREGGRHLDVEVVADLVRAELAGGGDLPRTPPARIRTGLHYHGPRSHAYGEIRQVFEQDRIAAEETPTDAYTMLDAGFTWRWIVGDQLVELLVRGRNLGDEEARNHVSFLKDRILLPGRDVGLSLRWSF